MSTMTPSAQPLQSFHSRLDKICIAIMGGSVAEMLEKAEAALADSTFLEFRLDYLPKPLAAVPQFKEFLAKHREVSVIGTCRREANGGNFKGSLDQEFEVLKQAAQAGFHLVDVELESAEEAQPAELERLRAAGAALLISYHDFKTTKGLDDVLDRMKPFSADFLKVVSTARSLSDNLAMMRLLERAKDLAQVVGICMGEQGVVSRVLGLRSGSAFTFASSGIGAETAPGQMDAGSLRKLLRIDSLDQTTKVYGVAGNPIKHSLSPLMQNTAFRKAGVNAVYLPLQTEKLSDLLSLVQEIPLSGLSVTMPLKQEILRHLEQIDPLAEKIGAVNTVVRQANGKLHGFNTDVAAIIRPLEKRMSIAGTKVLVLGAGGAARAAVFGLKDQGAEVFLLNRSAAPAERLAKEAGVNVVLQSRIAELNFEAIVNATPCGMAGVEPTHILEPEELKAGLVFDMVYNPMETPLLRMARKKDIAVVTGVEMFVHQGARQFELWTGKPAPEEEMLQAVMDCLQARERAAKI